MRNNLYYQDEYIKETFNFKMFARMFKSAGRHKGLMLACVFLELITSALALLPNIIFSMIVDDVFPKDGLLPTNYMLTAGLCLGGFALVWAALAIGYYFEWQIPGKFGYLFCAELRTDVFNRLTVLDFRYFDTHSTGKILVRVTNYVDEVSSLFSTLFYTIMYCAFIVVIGMAWLVALDWRIGGAVAIAFLPLSVIMYFLGRAVHKRAGRDRNKNANYTAFVAENINGAEVVQAYNRGDINREAAQQLYDEYSKAFMRTTHVREAFFPMAHGFTKTLFLILAYGVALAVLLTGWGGGLALGTVVAIGSVLGDVTNSTGHLCNHISSIFTLSTNLERIYDTMETPVDIADCEDAVPLENCRGNVAFEHVDFAYVQGIPVLKDFTLRANAGETVAIVGATGSGKTTIVNLLSRFYEVGRGRITIDGTEIHRFTLHSLRENVGVMMQDTYIFSGTVMENIRFSRPDATDEECVAAAVSACADGFISRLPQGYETEISESYALSGGERQLLSFARLILADPKIVVLDEATSHIDTQTEREIQQSLRALLAGRTSFVIAHRLSTIRGADKIVYLSDGEIAEQGTHGELLARNGLYAKLIRSAV